jgi:FlaA1/EpsC-like NDP-sugar epimerase
MPNVVPSHQFPDEALEGLLGRNPAHLDEERAREKIHGRVVMVTGAAGSIGSELCRQIARFDPLALVGLDQAETPLFELERELDEAFTGVRFHSEIGNIACIDDVKWVMEKYNPSIVYHAAAYKHVSMMEKHPFAAVENNIFGTWIVARAAANHCVDSFVLISTDKAVSPCSILGVTKRCAELAIFTLQKSCGTKFVAVRFGNVFGSSGSVVPIFRQQIAAGGPVTVTHPEMRRYFMTAAEASQLVLQAFVLGNGGETFVLDMGEPIRILDLAMDLIRLSGLEPGKDIEIHFTGPRPGEKLREELNLQTDHLAPTSHPRVRSVTSSENVGAKDFEEFLHNIQQAATARDNPRMTMLLQKLVPDYTPSSQLHIDRTPVRLKNSAEGDAQIPCPGIAGLPIERSGIENDEPVELSAAKV